MSKSVKDCLIEIFDDLDDEQFRRFKTKLVDRKEEPRIRKGMVQNADRLDLAGKLVSTFTEKDAGKVAIDILNNLGFTQEASDLQDSLDNVSQSSGERGDKPSASSPSDSKFMVKGKHFVDFHRTSLINRICQVDSILDRLLDKEVINSSTYKSITAESTDEKKMRQLYMGPLTSCGNKGKDVLYQILEELQPYLMGELKESQ